jgi:hypothetical protein
MELSGFPSCLSNPEVLDAVVGVENRLGKLLALPATPFQGGWSRKPVSTRINIAFLKVRPVNLPVRNRQRPVKRQRVISA